MSDQGFLSNATNFGLTPDYHVNLRTGSLSFALNLAHIACATTLQRTLDLKYSPGSNGYFGLPAQWSLNLSYIQNDTLYIDGSKSYRLLDDKIEYSGLKYYKLKDMKLEAFSVNPQTLPYPYASVPVQYFYKLSFLNGDHHYFDSYGKLIAIDNTFGVYILFYYTGDLVEEAVLTKIVDYYGNEIHLTRKDDSLVINSSGQIYTLYTSLVGIERVVDPLGNTTQLTYNGGSIGTLLSQVDKSNGLSVLFGYGNLAYKQGDNTYYHDAVTLIKTIDQQGTITKQTTYEYTLDINSNNYTGYPKYAVDRQEDIVLQSDDNDFKYITRVIDDVFTTLYYYNRLHLELQKEVYTTADTQLIAKELYSYCGQGSNDYFPPYNALPANYQTPTRVVNVISDPNKGVSRVYRTDSEFDEYGQLTRTQQYQSALGDETVADKLTMLSESRLVYDYADTQYQNKPQYYGTVTKKYEYDYSQSESDPTIYVQYQTLSEDLKTVIQKTVGTAAALTVDISQYDDHFIAEKISEYTYDALGRVVHEKLSLIQDKVATSVPSTEYRLQYDISEGKLITTLYDAMGNSSQKILELSTGVLIQEINALGNQHTYEYDELDRKIKETDAIGTVTQWHYDDKHNTITTQYANGYTIKSYQDAFGNPLRVTDNTGDGNIEKVLSQTFYNTIGQVTSHQDIRGAASAICYEYDNQGLIKRIMDALGNEISEDLNPAALSQQAMFNGFKINESLINDHGKVFKTTLFGGLSDPDVQIQAKYNAFDKTVWGMQGSKDEGSYIESSTDYNYEMHPIASTLKPSDGQILKSTNTLDIFGNTLQTILSLTTQTDQTTSATSDYYQTNPLNQIIQITNNLKQAQTLKYDAAGRIIEVQDYAGTVFYYSYNLDGTLKTHEFTDKIGKKYCRLITYDPNTKQVLSIEEFIDNQSQGKFDYQYRLDGKLISMTYPDGKAIKYSYDQYNSITNIEDIQGNITTYSYDIYGRITSVSNADRKSSVALTYFSKAENPKHSGQIKTKLYDNGLMEAFTYDDFSRVSTYSLTDSTSGSGKTLLTLTYTYDKVKGNILKLISQSDQLPTDVQFNHIKEYTYDGLNRLIAETLTKSNGSLIQHIDYTYDVAGNLTYAKTTHAKGEFTEERFSYDLDNKLLAIEDNIGTLSFTYDINGNLLSDSRGKTYTYDAENRLIAFKDSVAKISATYEYYANGLRKRKTVNDSQPITFYYDVADLPNIINEVQGNSTTSYLTFEAQRLLRYVDLDSSKSNYSIDYIISNYKDIIAALDQKKSIQQLKAYDPYGKPRDFTLERKLKRTISDLQDNPFGYNGEYADSESGLIYLRTRYYNPSIRRFIIRDSAPTFNRYAYCNGNPIMQTDPSGCAAEGVLGTVLELSPKASVASFTSESTAAGSFLEETTAATTTTVASTGAMTATAVAATVAAVVVAVAVVVVSILALFGVFSGSGATAATASAGGGRPPRKPTNLPKVNGHYANVEKIIENAKQVQAMREFSKQYPDLDLNSISRADAHLQQAFHIVYPELRGGLRGGAKGDNNQPRPSLLSRIWQTIFQNRHTIFQYRHTGYNYGLSWGSIRAGLPAFQPFQYNPQSSHARLINNFRFGMLQRYISRGGSPHVAAITMGFSSMAIFGIYYFLIPGIKNYFNDYSNYYLNYYFNYHFGSNPQGNDS